MRVEITNIPFLKVFKMMIDGIDIFELGDDYNLIIDNINSGKSILEWIDEDFQEDWRGLITELAEDGRHNRIDFYYVGTEKDFIRFKEECEKVNKKREIEATLNFDNKYVDEEVYQNSIRHLAEIIGKSNEIDDDVILLVNDVKEDFDFEKVKNLHDLLLQKKDRINKQIKDNRDSIRDILNDFDLLNCFTDDEYLKRLDNIKEKNKDALLSSMKYENAGRFSFMKLETGNQRKKAIMYQMSRIEGLEKSNNIWGIFEKYNKIINEDDALNYFINGSEVKGLYGINSIEKIYVSLQDYMDSAYRELKQTAEHNRSTVTSVAIGVIQAIHGIELDNTYRFEDYKDNNIVFERHSKRLNREEMINNTNKATGSMEKLSLFGTIVDPITFKPITFDESKFQKNSVEEQVRESYVGFRKDFREFKNIYDGYLLKIKKQIKMVIEELDSAYYKSNEIGKKIEIANAYFINRKKCMSLMHDYDEMLSTLSIFMD